MDGNTNLLGLIEEAEKGGDGIDWSLVNQILLKANSFAGIVLKQIGEEKKDVRKDKKSNR
jgi:hypothetical protein